MTLEGDWAAGGQVSPFNAEMNAALELIDSGILYINPDPSRWHVWAATAHPVALSGTEFIATYQRGAAMYAADSDMAITRSHDGGVTWAHEKFLYDKARDDRPCSYHDGFLGPTRDGTLAALAFRMDRTDPDRPHLQRRPAACCRSNAILFTSSDEGAQLVWTARPRFAWRFDLTPANPILELADGRWLATFDQWHGFDEPGPYQTAHAGRLLGRPGADLGRDAVLADGTGTGIGFWHGKTLRLANGQLYSTFWAADLGDSRRARRFDLPVSLASGPSGHSWSMPGGDRSPGADALAGRIARRAHGRVYTRRDSRAPGIPGGALRRWRADLGHRERGPAVGRDRLDASRHSTPPEVYPHSHDTVAFGAPTCCHLLRGDLYATGGVPTRASPISAGRD